MKKSVKLLALVIAVVMVSACFAATTMAKYYSSVSIGKKTTAVAQWIGDDFVKVTFADLFKSSYGEEDEELAKSTAPIIAPGLEGSSSITISFDEDDVPQVAYTLTLDKVETIKSTGLDNLKWYMSTVETNNPTYADELDDDIELDFDDYAAGETPEDVTIYVYWKWEWVNDSENTVAALENAGASIELSLKVEQINTFN